MDTCRLLCGSSILMQILQCFALMQIKLRPPSSGIVVMISVVVTAMISAYALQIYIEAKQARFIFERRSNDLSPGICCHAPSTETDRIPKITTGHIDTTIITSGRDIFCPEFPAFLGRKGRCVRSKDHFCTPQRVCLGNLRKMGFNAKLDAHT